LNERRQYNKYMKNDYFNPIIPFGILKKYPLTFLKVFLKPYLRGNGESKIS